MDEITLKNIQNKEFEILLEFKRICEKYDIHYSLYRGTMLGSVKYKGFIPWDDDMDVIMLEEDYKRFLSVVDEELDNERFFFQNSDRENNFDIPFCNKIRFNGTKLVEEALKDKEIHHGVWMDIFVLYNYDGEEEKLDRFRKHFKIWKSKYRFKSEFKKKNFKGKIISLFYELIPPFCVKKWFEKIKKEKEALGNDQSDYLVELFHNRGDIVKKSDISYTELKFNGRLFKVFSYYDPILKMLYGENYMNEEPDDKISPHEFCEVEV